jgi:hypothetical protein
MQECTELAYKLGILPVLPYPLSKRVPGEKRNKFTEKKSPVFR